MANATLALLFSVLALFRGLKWDKVNKIKIKQLFFKHNTKIGFLKVFKPSKLSRRNPRKSKTFYSQFISSILSGIIIGIFFAIILHQTELPSWDRNILNWIIWLILAIFFLYLFYKYGLFLSHGLNEQVNFHNNYLMNIFTTIFVVLLVLHNNLIKFQWINAGAALLFSIVYFFICREIFLRIKQSR